MLGALFTNGHFFRLLDGEIADVFDLKAEFLDAGLETCAAKGGRAHIHAAAALAEVHRNADDANFLRHICLCPVNRGSSRAKAHRERPSTSELKLPPPEEATSLSLQPREGSGLKA